MTTVSLFPMLKLSLRNKQGIGLCWSLYIGDPFNTHSMVRKEENPIYKLAGKYKKIKLVILKCGKCYMSK